MSMVGGVVGSGPPSAEPRSAAKTVRLNIIVGTLCVYLRTTRRSSAQGAVVRCSVGVRASRRFGAISCPWSGVWAGVGQVHRSAGRAQGERRENAGTGQRGEPGRAGELHECGRF